jgi:hypothetical protein
MFKNIRRYLYGVLIGIDQFGNTLAGGNPDETISSRLGRLKLGHGGRLPWHHPLARLIDSGLEVVDRHHSMESIDSGTVPDKARPYAARIVCGTCGDRMTRYISADESTACVCFRYCQHCRVESLHRVMEVYND